MADLALLSLYTLIMTLMFASVFPLSPKLLTARILSLDLFKAHMVFSICKAPEVGVKQVRSQTQSSNILVCILYSFCNLVFRRRLNITHWWRYCVCVCARERERWRSVKKTRSGDIYIRLVFSWVKDFHTQHLSFYFKGKKLKTKSQEASQPSPWLQWFHGNPQDPVSGFLWCVR